MSSVLDIIREKHGEDFHPAILLADVSADASQDIKLRVDCSKTLMPYVAQSLKAIEVRGNVDINTGLLRVTNEPEIKDED